MIYGTGEGFPVGQKSKDPQSMMGARGMVDYPLAGERLSLRASMDLSQGAVAMAPNPNGAGSIGVPYPGKVWIYAGGPAPSSAPTTTLTAPSSFPYLFNGTTRDLDGDGVPELLVCQATEQAISHDRIAIYRGTQGAVPARVLPGFSDRDAFGFTIGQ